MKFSPLMHSWLLFVLWHRVYCQLFCGRHPRSQIFAHNQLFSSLLAICENRRSLFSEVEHVYCPGFTSVAPPVSSPLAIELQNSDSCCQLHLLIVVIAVAYVTLQTMRHQKLSKGQPQQRNNSSLQVFTVPE